MVLEVADFDEAVVSGTRTVLRRLGLEGAVPHVLRGVAGVLGFGRSGFRGVRTVLSRGGLVGIPLGGLRDPVPWLAFDVVRGGGESAQPGRVIRQAGPCAFPTRSIHLLHFRFPPIVGVVQALKSAMKLCKQLDVPMVRIFGPLTNSCIHPSQLQILVQASLCTGTSIKTEYLTHTFTHRSASVGMPTLKNDDSAQAGTFRHADAGTCGLAREGGHKSTPQ
jgi:hypothetical protein